MPNTMFVIPFEIDANRYNVRIGDWVSPQTIIGADFATGAAIRAGCYGQVIGVAYSGGSPILTIFVRPDSNSQACVSAPTQESLA
ncbi:MAG: hypothetical protein N2559_13330 [Anaerolineae bacterium]|nr:hypothetical protein [Anaerolineae bacterium]